MSTLRLTTISNQTGSASVPSDTVINGSAKAWVNFNGTGTVAIRASFNVSSITDNGTGDYTVNFSTAMVDANYSAIFASNLSVTAANAYPGNISGAGAGQLAASVRFLHYESNNPTDAQVISTAVFR